MGKTKAEKMKQIWNFLKILQFSTPISLQNVIFVQINIMVFFSSFPDENHENYAMCFVQKIKSQTIIVSVYLIVQK